MLQRGRGDVGPKPCEQGRRRGCGMAGADTLSRGQRAVLATRCYHPPYNPPVLRSFSLVLV